MFHSAYPDLILRSKTADEFCELSHDELDTAFQDGRTKFLTKLSDFGAGALGLPHSSEDNDIMERGFDRSNRIFMKHVDGAVITDSAVHCAKSYAGTTLPCPGWPRASTSAPSGREPVPPSAPASSFIDPLIQ